MRMIKAFGISTLLLGLYILPLSAHEGDQLSAQQAQRSIEQSQIVDQLSVKLNNIQKIHLQDKWGDELYISVTEFSENQKPRFKQIPAFPSHWTSSHIDKVKDVVLWQKQMKECEASTVVFSLVEQDMTPWDPDDLLGSVQLNVTCDQGKMQTHWSIPNKTNTFLIQPSTNGFVFKSKGAEYRAAFNVEQNKAPLQNRNILKEPRIQLRDRLLFP